MCANGTNHNLCYMPTVNPTLRRNANDEISISRFYRLTHGGNPHRAPNLYASSYAILALVAQFPCHSIANGCGYFCSAPSVVSIEISYEYTLQYYRVNLSCRYSWETLNKQLHYPPRAFDITLSAVQLPNHAFSWHMLARHRRSLPKPNPKEKCKCTSLRSVHIPMMDGVFAVDFL